MKISRKKKQIFLSKISALLIAVRKKLVKIITPILTHRSTRKMLKGKYKNLYSIKNVMRNMHINS